MIGGVTESKSKRGYFYDLLFAQIVKYLFLNVKFCNQSFVVVCFFEEPIYSPKVAFV